jgi:hypothetical protein
VKKSWILTLPTERKLRFILSLESAAAIGRWTGDIAAMLRRRVPDGAWIFFAASAAYAAAFLFDGRPAKAGFALKLAIALAIAVRGLMKLTRNFRLVQIYDVIVTALFAVSYFVLFGHKMGTTMGLSAICVMVVIFATHRYMAHTELLRAAGQQH